eukprot:GHVQ01027887.1.p1 GENE.GHVQ01027887.1~~GHVQ01027887.1.p1  ORF type:complete len:242 (+),score=19.56 GHVQ01027887.1:363-1088(+)
MARLQRNASPQGNCTGDEEIRRGRFRQDKGMDVSNVLMYVPNVIGYVRIVLVIVCCWLAHKSWIMTVLLYGSSQFMDALDGWTARRYGQVSVFGAVLDQVTDRLSTVLLYFLNVAAYPEYLSVVFLLCVVDLGGHWMYVFSSMVSGEESHKKIPTCRPVLKLYYELPGLMFITHACYELFWLVLFVDSRLKVASFLVPFLMYSTMPLTIFKVYVNIEQVILAAQILATKARSIRPAESPSR